jgi:2-polyprenyl-6-methoxyphenol hydroxylase-like FAD-dependent oxidoreductase
MGAEHYDADVLIVGAGPVGLALATELTMRGHTVRVVERNERTGVQPRAKTTNIRTMTHMRRWGLASEMRKRSPISTDFPRDVTFRTGLFDEPIYTFHDAFCATPKRYDAFPEHAEFIPQYFVEGILADHVAGEPLANLTFGTEFLGFEQDEDGVTGRLKNRASGEDSTVRARFLVGADGGRSSIRASLGIAMNGKYDIGFHTTLILRIPGLNDDPDLKHGLFHWIIDAEAASIIGPMDKGDLWFWGKTAGKDVSTETLLGHARHAIGRDYPLELVIRDDWTVHSLIADHYREGHIFLAGDACHLHSPFGGHGMNQGIGDAVDLGWKLSAALQGWASEGLLDSYTIERQQAHKAIVASATKNVASLSENFVDPDLKTEGPAGDAARRKTAAAIERLKAPEFQSVGLVLGNSYVGSPAVAEEPGADIEVEISNYVPSARPGHLAPHAWLDDNTSLYDLFAKGFTLLRFSEKQDRAEAALEAAARQKGIPIEIVSPGLPGLKDLYDANYALVRPDQYVGWRGNALPAPETLISVMMGRADGKQQIRQSA